MSSSASDRQNSVLFDTNVLSLFAKIKRLSLLLQAFADVHRRKQLFVSPAIRRELETGVQLIGKRLTTANAQASQVLNLKFS